MNSDYDKNFEEDKPHSPIAYGDIMMQADKKDDGALFLDIDGFEGPIDLLLKLAREQKVDLIHISILQLARQYLSFVDKARELSLDLAAEYLVMAAWLAYLKSRLLLPKNEDEEEELSGEEMAKALAFQLRRLEAIQNAAEQLFKRPQLGVDIYARGMAEGLDIDIDTSYDVDLYDLLRIYGDIQRRKDNSTYELIEYNLMSMEDAMAMMTRMLGKLPKKGIFSVWTTLTSFLPDGNKDKLLIKSSLASMLTAGLELAKQGRLEIKQDGLFKPIYIRAYERNREKDES